mgnify:CR=1 FL=1
MIGSEMMIRNAGVYLALAATLGAGGCANSVSKTMSTALASAPDWFDERREEVAGNGYPELSAIPPTPKKTSVAELKQIESEQDQLQIEAKDLEADSLAKSGIETGRESPTEWANRVRAEFPDEEEVREPQTAE